MKTCQSTGYLQQAVKIVLLGIVSVVGLSTPLFALNPPNQINACFDCHGSTNDIRPVDSVLRNITTGGFKGSHRTHMQVATTINNVCAKCHISPAAADFNHRNGVIAMRQNINSSASVRGTYNKPQFFNQTSVPTLANCSNVNCHFKSATPTWGVTSFASQKTAGSDTNNTCQQCHSNAALSAAHNRHLAYFGGTTAVSGCNECHADNNALGGLAAFSHATSLAPSIRTDFSQPPNSGSGTITGKRTYPNYLPGGTISSATCSGLYCHSDGSKASGFTSNLNPQWNSTLTCASCHGYKVGSSAVLGSGTHTAHINSAVAGRTGENFSCDQCHKATTSNGTTISNLANHVNKAINVNMTSTSVGVYSTTGHAPGGAFGSCSNTTCHNIGRTGTTGGTASATVIWGTPAGANKCAICHGGGNAIGSPDYTSGAAGSATANSHNAHALVKGINCLVCHNQTTTTGTSIVAGGGRHLDGSNQDVYFVGTYNGQAQASAAYTAATKTCSNTYCHLSSTPQWGAQLNCRGCHGGDAASSSPMATGKHTAHTNPVLNASLGLGNGFQCAACHAKTVSFGNNTSITTQANHVNGLIDYSGVRAGGSSKYSTATKQCSGIYCHSNGNPGALVYINMTGSKLWSGSASNTGCNFCHGRSNLTTGAPDYANGGAGSTTANSHPKHVAGAGIADTRGCANCHAKTVSQTVASTFKDYTAVNYHLNGTPNLIFKSLGGKTGAWSGSNCSATYCHGTAASPAWGSPSLACNACHSASSVLPGAHPIHVATATLASSYTNMSGNVSSAASYRFSCAACHKGTHANGPANANGVAEVQFGYTSATRKGSYTYGTTQGNDNGFNWTNGGGGCNTSYCHSNGQAGGSGLTAVAWSTTASSGTCVQCHDTRQTGATATGLSGKHDAHMNPTNNVSLGLGNGLNCIDCHAKTVSGNTAIANKSKHVNKFIDFSSMHGGGSAKYSTATKLCSNIYCHSNGNQGAIVYTNPAAWNSVTTYNCNGCHGTSNPATGAPDYVNGGAGTTTANSHAKHVSALGITDTTGCSNCHVKTANQATANKFKDYTAAGYHLNGTTNVIFNAVKAGASASWTPGTNVCSNVACHGGNNATWGSTLNCQDCHGNGAVASVADFGTTFWNNGTMSKFQMTGTGSWAGNGHGLASGTYASGNPAANFGAVTNQCEFCHDTTVGHQVSSNAFRLKNYSTASYGRNAPCLICHSATGGGVTSPAVKNRTTSAVVEADHYGAKHGAGNNGGQFCWDCHDPHGNGTSNLYMVRTNPAKVSNRATGAPTTQTATAVVFTAKATGTDFANGTTFNGVCNVCHTSTSHYTSTSGDGHNATAACVTCHNHKGTAHGSDAFAPSGDCNSCHDYDTVGATYSGGKWTGGTWGKLNLGAYPTANEGWGAHNKHINFIKTRLGIAAALTATTQTFGVGVPANICGTCHTNNASNHNLSATSGQDPTGRTINFGDSTFKVGGATGASILFGASNPLYNGVSGTSSATTAKTCSNLSCHYFTTPLWSTY